MSALNTYRPLRAARRRHILTEFRDTTEIYVTADGGFVLCLSATNRDLRLKFSEILCQKLSGVLFSDNLLILLDYYRIIQRQYEHFSFLV